MENKKVKILAIDDIRDNLVIIKAQIGEALPDAVTLTTLNGISGIELAKVEDPDVILLDIIMPGIDGYEVCRRLKADPGLKDIPVVFLTAKMGDSENRIKALEAGAEGFLSKPVDPYELIAQLKAMIKIKAANVQKRDKTQRLAREVEVRTRDLKLANEATLRILEELKVENEARKKSESELFQSKETYLDIINSVYEAIYIQDPESGKFIDVNKGAENMYGFSREELIGQTPFTIAAPDMNDLDDIWQRVKEVFTTGVPIRFDFWALRKNGEAFPKEVIVNKGKYFGKEVLIATARDISEKMRSEEKLRRSHAYNKAMLGANPDMCFVLDKNCNFIDFHTPSVNSLYAPPDEFLGRKVEEVLPPDVATLIYTNVENIFKSGKQEYCTFGLQINNESLFFEWRGVPFENDKVLSFVRDITELRQLENDLKHSNEKLLSAQRLANIGVWEWIIDSDIVIWSDELYKILGLDPKKPAPSFANHSGLYTPESWLKLKHAVENGLMNGEPYQLELEMLHTDSSIRNVYAFGGVKRDTNGRITGLYGTVQDITDRKQAEINLRESEQRFREVLENSFDAAYRRDLVTDTYDYLSSSFFPLTGYTIDEMRTMPIKEYLERIHPDDLQRINTFVQESANSITNPHYTDYRFLHKNGEYRWFGDLSAIVKDEDGKLLYRYGSIQDITERKMDEELLREHKDFLDLILQTVPDPVTVVSLSDNTVLQVNKEFTRLTGWSSDEVLGKTHAGFDIWVIPEDRKRLIDCVVKDGFADSIEAKFRLKNKRIITGLISAKKIFFRGKPCLVTITRDITDRKKHEEAILLSHERARRQQITISQLIIDDAIVASDVDKAFQRFSQIVCETVDVERASVWLFSENDTQLVCKTLYEASKGAFGERTIINTEDYPSYFESIRQENIISANDAINDPRTCEMADDYLKKAGITSMLDTGIQIEGQLLGIVCLEHVGQRREWNADEESFVSTIAAMLGQLIANDRRKKAEKDLQEKQHFINKIAENSPNIIYLFDLATDRNIYTNRSVSTLLGYLPYEISDDDPDFFKKLIHPDDLRQFDSFYEEIGSWPEQKVFEYEYRIRAKSDEWRWFKGREKEFQRVNGKIVTLIGTVQDITAAKIAENAIAENEEKFRLLITQMEQGLAVHEAIFNESGEMIDYRFIDMNESFEKLTGLRREDILGKRVLEILPRTEKYWIEAYGRVVKTGKPVHFENYSGELGRYYEVVAYRNRENQFAVIVTDITHRKHSELTQHILYNIAGQVLVARSLEELIGKSQIELSKLLDTTNFLVALYDNQKQEFHKVIYHDEKDDFITWKAENSLSGQVVKRAKTLLLNGTQIAQLAADENLDLIGTPAACWLGVPLMTQAKIYGALVIQSYTNPKAYDNENATLLEMVAHEISIFIERQQMIENLKIAKEKAEENDRLKSAFLANMSHEIRTPMNGILGFTDLLKEPEINFADQQKYIDIIEKSGQRLLNLINDLIDISKIEAEQVSIFLSEVDIQQEVKILHTFFLPEADTKSLRFSLQLHPVPHQGKILTDKDKLLSIFSNLIKNAIKFTNDGEIAIGYLQEGNFIRFFVKDTGRGIPLDKQQMIFDRFGQADVSLTRNHEGAGLGLSIAKAYVEMLGGNIGLTSEPGVGSEFYFTLPINDEKNSEQTLTVDVSDTPELKIAPRKIKVLVAEDDEFSIQYFSIKLKDIAKEIYYTKTGLETVEFCRKNPDTELVLMDIKMPGVDGLQATRMIRQFNQSVVIIAQTAYALSGDREKSLIAGCNDYLSKPIKKEELEQIIAKYFY